MLLHRYLAHAVKALEMWIMDKRLPVRYRISASGQISLRDRGGNLEKVFVPFSVSSARRFAVPVISFLSSLEPAAVLHVCVQ